MSIPFPPLFACACAKDWSVEQGRGCWNPIGIRLFNDWELEHVKRLLSLLRGKKVIEELGGGGEGGLKTVCFLLNLCIRCCKRDPLLLSLGKEH